MKRVALLACTALLVAGCGTMYDAMEDSYQRAMDPVRIKHVDYLASVTTEFFQKTGRMPLADRVQEDKRVTVFITHRPVAPTYLEQAARLPVVVVSADDLKVDLEKGLGRTINLPSDPQNFSSYGPNLYIYDFNGFRACVYGHLFFEVPGATLVELGGRNKYYKYQYCIISKAA